jgi:hypothetical protein
MRRGLSLTRAQAEHLGGTRVRFSWPCGTTRTKDYSKGPVAKRITSEFGVQFLSRYWRDGITAACPKHGRDARKCKPEGESA